MNSPPLGVRLNNPGNVKRISSTQWEGESKDQPDSVFLKFDGPQWGFRCMARILLVHHDRGEHTVRRLISSWAPPSENETDAYIYDVCKRLNVSPDDDLPLPGRLLDLISAITHHEQGESPWADDIIQHGIDLERST